MSTCRHRYRGWLVDLSCRRRVCAAGARFSLDPLNVGDCRVIVKVANPRGGDQVGIVVDQTLREQAVIAGEGTLVFQLSEPLRAGSAVRARVNVPVAERRAGRGR